MVTRPDLGDPGRQRHRRAELRSSGRLADRPAGTSRAESPWRGRPVSPEREPGRRPFRPARRQPGRT